MKSAIREVLKQRAPRSRKEYLRLPHTAGLPANDQFRARPGPVIRRGLLGFVDQNPSRPEDCVPQGVRIRITDGDDLTPQ
jgi:hypothetical protein